ncbi:Type IV secretion system protein PtlH [Erwinia aphidicola]|uniref:P-type DNA transfer ATPase VirB11 n=1 Tax=Erwinia aphidicola TaxID=68334 RepID=UPI001E0F29AF|nr:P-type DNA transfer ATPase VirB11 [Erwinia aphidicola]CAH0299536.1 Type IV secretion system protein PtlH [Erwinia aphidicola]
MKDLENKHIIYDFMNDYFHQWLNDVEGLTEVAVNRPDELFIKVKGKWQQQDLKMSFSDCLSFAGAISDFHDGGSVTPEYPLRSATLPLGERVQIVMPPATEKETVSITIRKPSSVFISHEDFVRQGFYTRLNQTGVAEKKDDILSKIFKENRFHEFIPEGLRQGKTMVFCAGTGAGKTTFANACLEYIPHYLRILTIEDTDEAKLRFHNNHVKLYYPSEGESTSVSSASLLRSGFRMNGDRILMTEVRGAEAWDFLKGSSSGHAGNLTTVHEGTPEDAVLGLVQRCYMNPECQNLPYNIVLRRVLSNVDIIMSMKYIDEEDSRFASGIYYRELHFEEYFRKLKE